ncbi:MAG: hypothetical protein QW400_01025 [Candidatus Diapherotrites archaeon]
MQNSEKEIEDLLLIFGVKRELLENYNIEKIGNSYWLTSKGLKSFEGFNVQCKGLRIAERTKLGLKPTSYGLQFFGQQIKENVVDLKKDELLSIIKGKPIAKSCKDGYIALRLEGYVVGCGLCKKGLVYSQLPKSIATALLELYG